MIGFSSYSIEIYHISNVAKTFHMDVSTVSNTMMSEGTINIILHCDKNWGIGKNNSLMFSLPKDVAFFRRMTKGNTVIMGTNTLLSFPGGKPLKNRTNIVLS